MSEWAEFLGSRRVQGRDVARPWPAMAEEDYRARFSFRSPAPPQAPVPTQSACFMSEIG